MLELSLSIGAIALVANVFSSFMKTHVYPRFGSTGVHVVTFLVAAFGAWFYIYGREIPSLMSFAVMAGGIFSLAVTFYEVILKKFDWFKVTTPRVEAARAEERG